MRRELGLVRAMADGPGGAERQLAVFERTGDLAAVARHMTGGYTPGPGHLAAAVHDGAGRAAPAARRRAWLRLRGPEAGSPASGRMPAGPSFPSNHSSPRSSAAMCRIAAYLGPPVRLSSSLHERPTA